MAENENNSTARRRAKPCLRSLDFWRSEMERSTRPRAGGVLRARVGADRCCGVAAAWLLLSLSSGCWASVPTPPRQAELLYMLEQDCGSCHGLRRAGGLGPPLTPEALAGKPPQYLAATISDGRPGTPMPPWRPFMTEAEVSWLVEQLLNPYPAETSRP